MLIYALTVTGKITLLAVCATAVLLTLRVQRKHWPVAVATGLCLLTQGIYVLSHKFDWWPPAGLLLFLATPVLSCWMTLAVIRYRHDWYQRVAFVVALLFETIWICTIPNPKEWWDFKLFEIPLGLLLLQGFVLLKGRSRLPCTTYKVLLVFAIGDGLYLLGRLLEAPWWVASTQAIVVNAAVILLQIRGWGQQTETAGSPSKGPAQRQNI